MNEAAPDVSAVIVSWNTRDLLMRCLETLCARDHGLGLEVIVVDNASADGSAAAVAEKFPRAVLIANKDNAGYAGGVNQGIERAGAPYVLLLGSDTEMPAGGVLALRNFLDSSEGYGAVAPQLVHADGSVQRSCARLPGLAAAFLHDSFLDRLAGGTRVVRDYTMQDFDHTESRDVEQPQTSCLLVKREVLEHVGGFDPDLFVFYNDVDFCKRLKEAGYRMRFLAGVSVLHHHGRSTAQLPDFVAELNVNRVRYFRKHHGFRGVVTVKSWALLRGVEETLQILWRPPGGGRLQALGKLGRSLGAIMSA